MEQIKLTLTDKKAKRIRQLACELDVSYDTLIGFMLTSFEASSTYRCLMDTLWLEQKVKETL